ncbi:MAG: hypothetical protein AABX08_01030 [Nanoarchaeota archaeon]
MVQMTNGRDLFVQLKGIVEAMDASRALDVLLIADLITHKEIRERKEKEGRLVDRYSLDDHRFAYDRLCGLLRDYDQLPLQLEVHVPHVSLAYVFMQFCKRDGVTKKQALNKLFELSDSLASGNGEVLAYYRIFSLLRDSVGLFPDGCGTCGEQMSASYKK